MRMHIHVILKSWEEPGDEAKCTYVHVYVSVSTAHLEPIPYPDNHQRSFRVSNEYTVYLPLGSFRIMWHHMIRDSTHHNANSVQLPISQLVATESSQPWYGSDLSGRVKWRWLLRFQWLIMAGTSGCKLKVLESVKWKMTTTFYVGINALFSPITYCPLLGLRMLMYNVPHFGAQQKI